MNHDTEIESIIQRVKPWPEEDRVALAYLILRDMRKKTREAAPRRTLDRALGIARGSGVAPDDATAKKWIDERREGITVEFYQRTSTGLTRDTV